MEQKEENFLNKNKLSILLIIALLIISLVGCANNTTTGEQINLMSWGGDFIPREVITEFEEETGIKPKGPFEEIKPVKYNSGKIVYAWAFKGTFDKSKFKSNSFSMEWPPKTGKTQEFAELVEPAMMDLNYAFDMIMRSQEPFIDSMKKFFETKNLR